MFFSIDSVPSLQLPIVSAHADSVFLPVFVKVPHMNPINRDYWLKVDDVLLCRQDGLRKKKYSMCVMCV